MSGSAGPGPGPGAGSAAEVDSSIVEEACANGLGVLGEETTVGLKWTDGPKAE